MCIFLLFPAQQRLKNISHSYNLKEAKCQYPCIDASFRQVVIIGIFPSDALLLIK